MFRKCIHVLFWYLEIMCGTKCSGIVKTVNLAQNSYIQQLCGIPPADNKHCHSRQDTGTSVAASSGVQCCCLTHCFHSLMKPEKTETGKYIYIYIYIYPLFNYTLKKSNTKLTDTVIVTLLAFWNKTRTNKKFKWMLIKLF